MKKARYYGRKELSAYRICGLCCLVFPMEKVSEQGQSVARKFGWHTAERTCSAIGWICGLEELADRSKQIQPGAIGTDRFFLYFVRPASMSAGRVSFSDRLTYTADREKTALRPKEPQKRAPSGVTHTNPPRSMESDGGGQPHQNKKPPQMERCRPF